MNTSDPTLATVLEELPELIVRFHATQPKDTSRITDRQIDQLRDARSELQIHLASASGSLQPLLEALDRLSTALLRPEPVALVEAMVAAMDALRSSGFGTDD